PRKALTMARSPMLADQHRLTRYSYLKLQSTKVTLLIGQTAFLPEMSVGFSKYFCATRISAQKVCGDDILRAMSKLPNLPEPTMEELLAYMHAEQRQAWSAGVLSPETLEALKAEWRAKQPVPQKPADKG